MNKTIAVRLLLFTLLLWLAGHASWANAVISAPATSADGNYAVTYTLDGSFNWLEEKEGEEGSGNW